MVLQRAVQDAPAHFFGFALPVHVQCDGWTGLEVVCCVGACKVCPPSRNKGFFNLKRERQVKHKKIESQIDFLEDFANHSSMLIPDFVFDSHQMVSVGIFAEIHHGQDQN